MKRLLVPSTALLWGLQFALLNPALALLLVALYDATAAEVGWVLAAYNASGFVASLVVPARADARGAYLPTMLVCGALTFALAVVLALVTTLPMVVIALMVLGGPAGVGSSLLYAHLRHSGADTSVMVNTRAVVSAAWIGGPPLATLVMGVFGERSILLVLAFVAVLNVATTAALMRSTPRVGADRPKPSDTAELPLSRIALGLVVAAFVALQATNSAGVAVMSLFVTERLGLAVLWAGVTLGVAAALEIPALLLVGRASRRFSSLGLLATGCLAGVGYYVGMALVTAPAGLLALQVLNAWFFANVAGVGLALFQQVIPRPGLAAGLYANCRRIGAIVSGPVIGFGSATALGYSGVFAVCAALTVLALVAVVVVGRSSAPTTT